MAIPLISRAACNIVIDGALLSATDVNGNTVEPFIENGTTYVPVRAVASAFDAEITWEQSTLTVYIGAKGGSPTLNEYINIYYNGEEFTAKDVNGNRVYPILREGTTYLPIRAVGELFGKKISWDSVSQTVGLISPCSDSAMAYFKSSVLNTELTEALTADVSFNGSLSYNGSLISEASGQGTEEYGSAGFSFASYLPPDYDSYVSYLGGGKYFLNVPSTAFSSSLSVSKALVKRNAEAVFSYLYITVETKSGYITAIDLSACGTTNYNDAVFDLSFTVSATVNYPESFQFPFTLPPSGGVNESTESDPEQSNPVTAGDVKDASAISALAASYIDYVLAADAESISLLLSPEDYKDLFDSRSQAQMNLNFSLAARNLENKYSGADGTYTVDSMDYIDDTSVYGEDCEKAVRISAGIIITDGDNSKADELTFTVIKIGEQWYIDKESMKSLIP